MSNRSYKALERALQVVFFTMAGGLIASILLGVYALADVVL